MSVKKSKDLRFTWQDTDGKLRVVHVSVQHAQEDGADEVRVVVTGDGVPLKVDTYDEPVKPVKTRSRM